MKTFKAHDGCSIRYATYTSSLKSCRGTVLLLGGRSEFIEKYQETVDEILARGFNVATFDWRGQGLSDRLLPNRHKGFVETYDDYLSDLNQFMDAYVRPDAARPLVILAHSMGAHIALRYLHDNPGSVEKAVLTSPLVDITGPLLFKGLMKILTQFAVAIGFKKHYATRTMNFVPQKKAFSGNRLTRDPQRFQKTLQMISHTPDVAIGGVTFGWLDATFKSIAHVMRKGYLESITTPICIISAGADKIVSVTAQRGLCRRLPSCYLVTIPDALHELMVETDDVREKIWEVFDNFLLSTATS